jgi:UDP-N-acetylmuramate--alanine ligase
MLQAERCKIPCVRRGNLLAELFNRKLGVAIAGTHGKTTTTGMAAHLMTVAGLDPTYALGGILNDTNSGVRVGKSLWFVAEADESDATFLHMQAKIGVITNIDADHLATYQGDFNQLKSAFADFCGHLGRDNLVIACVDDANVVELLPKMPSKVATYGFCKGAHYRITDFKQDGLCSKFTVNRPAGLLPLAVELNMPGAHNVQNAVAVIALATTLRIADDVIVKAISTFPGVGRRFHAHGSVAVSGGEALLFEDYGHHPREVKATLSAAKQAWPGRRVVMVFQPHRYTRTRDLMQEFAAVLCEADVLIVTDIYAASEEPIQNITGQALCDAISAHGKVEPIFVAAVSDLAKAIQAQAKANDVILLQGAGNIGVAAVDLT